MNLKKLLIRIRGMKDRDGLSQIINAAEARDSILSNIEGKRTRNAMWEKVMKLGLKKGDTVFIHVGAREVGTKGQGSTKVFSSKKHENLWGRPLTIKSIKPRNKEIEVQIMGLGQTKLSPFECASLKLSTEPSAAALANSLQQRCVREVGRGEDKTGRYVIEESTAPNGDTIVTRTQITFNARKKK